MERETTPLTLAVFGALGGVGRNVVRLALAAGHSVRALEPTWPDEDDLPSGIERRTANVLGDDVAPALEGCDAVISCIGVGMTARNAVDPPPLYSDGTDTIIAGMRTAGIARIVVISASFVVTADRGPLHFRIASTAALSRIFDQMGEMEHRLRRADDLEWTAVRPGWLMDAPETEDYTITDEVIPEDMIRTRQADLAHFMLRCVEDRLWIRRTPAIARHEADSDSGVAAILGEMAG